jgi:serine-type D-Ala-D-Ala carboxypeptidase/endopeptidase (penicillin-binding protein 4)
MSRTASGQAFRDSLPVAGTDGTLGGRLEKLNGRVAAKTGYITYDHALSGYLTTTKGELLAFSIMSNDQTGRGNSIRLIDQIVTLLAEFPNVPSPANQKAQ